MLKYVYIIILFLSASSILTGCQPNNEKKANTYLFDADNFSANTELMIKYRLGHSDYFEGSMVVKKEAISGNRELSLLEGDHQNLLSYLNKIYTFDEGVMCDLYLEINMVIVKDGKRGRSEKLVDRACSWEKEKSNFPDVIGFMHTNFPEPHWRDPGSTSGPILTNDSGKGSN